MIKDIQRVQQQLEGTFLAEVAEVDAAAVALHDQSPRLARDYLTDYSGRAGDGVVARWRELSDELLYKYLDGNIKDEFGRPQFEGYPEQWYRMVAEATGEKLQMRKTPTEVAMEQAAQDDAREVAESVLVVLEARGLDLSQAQRERVLGNDDAAQLRRWLVDAATATSAEAVVGAAD
jgi:hypothetical protein